MTGWAPELPRYPLLDGPSPLQRMPRFSAAIGGGADVWIKRDDLLPFGLGGSELRSLEFLVGAALAEGADTLVTWGRRWSNLCRLTAAAGARTGLEVHVVVSGPALGPPSANQRLTEQLGAAVHVASSDERAELEQLATIVTGDLRTGGRRPYLIAPGGSGVVGAVGHVLAGVELADQAGRRGTTFDTIVLPSPTGVVQAGLLVGLRLAGSAARVIGVAVASRPETVQRAVTSLLDELGTLTGQPVPPGDVEVDGSELEPGDGRPSRGGVDAIRRLAGTEAIFVDPIRTAKALAWVIAAAKSGALAGQTVAFWHAGGTPALFERFEP